MRHLFRAMRRYFASPWRLPLRVQPNVIVALNVVLEVVLREGGRSAKEEVGRGQTSGLPIECEKAA